MRKKLDTNPDFAGLGGVGPVIHVPLLHDIFQKSCELLLVVGQVAARSLDQGVKVVNSGQGTLEAQCLVCVFHGRAVDKLERGQNLAEIFFGQLEGFQYVFVILQT